MKRLLFLMLINIISVSSMNGELDVQAADKAFQKEDFEKAEKIYSTLLSSGLYSEGLYYNSILSKLSLGDTVSARLLLEQARIILPSSTPIEVKLNEVKEVINDEYAFPAHSIFTLLFELHYRGYGRYFLYGLIVCLWGFLLFYVLKLKNGDSPLDGFRKGALLVAAMMTILLILMCFSEQYYSRYGLITTTAELYIHPDLSSERGELLSGGQKVRIQDEVGTWYKVVSAKGEEGWTSTKVEQIFHR